MPAVTPAYAALLGLIFILLSVRVIIARRRGRIAFGSGGDADLERRIRIQANFAEYVPFALLLLFFAEQGGASPGALHVLCGALLAGRIAHAIGLSHVRWDDLGRIAGMTGTQVAILGAVVLILMR
ncbi:MAG: MAPEG family protein [Rhodospirillaceae bacterium]